VNQGPAITSGNITTFTVGANGTFTVTATGSPTPTRSESGALPSGVTFNAATGVLSGTPAAGTVGTYNISFNASNGVGSDACRASR
jgi:putative Ig domain-containing protein